MRNTARQTRENRTLTIDFQNEATYFGVNPNGIQLSVTASILICCEKSLFMHFQKDL